MPLLPGFGDPTKAVALVLVLPCWCKSSKLQAP